MSADGDALRVAATVLRRHQWRNEREVQELEEFAAELDVQLAPVPKTREEMAAFATAWDAKVDASRARHG